MFRGETNVENKACLTGVDKKGGLSLEIQDGFDGGKRDGKTRKAKFTPLGKGKGFKSDIGVRAKNIVVTTGCAKMGLECGQRYPAGYNGVAGKNKPSYLKDWDWYKHFLGLDKPADEWVSVSRAGLGAVTNLPRCLAIDFRGSHFAIATSEEEMGAEIGRASCRERV